ncbi:hypothetical protein PLICRDRAFT_513912 [Plicaturopsis crispa FD-325 SS-3]|nr:hypothetical protein PLICRDRAFT_513912 [Plicaturopsis crispa FD-325 SS-3]
MRYRTLEIRWHDSKPISTCDFQPVPFKRARPTQDSAFAAQSWRLATGGEDNHVRIWMVHPNVLPTSVVESAFGSTTDAPAPRPPRVEYLATLSKHTAAVNVVRFSPNGELIASAGDDGMIIIWAPSTTPQSATYGSDLSPEDLQYEKEHWKPRTIFRCTQMQVYDLAWSPTGEYILAGSTDNCARVYVSQDGKCVHEIAEHNHYVQGVAWDPMNEYIATQSSDRSMHVYGISTKNGTFEAHAVGKNSRMPFHRSRTPSTHSHSHSRPRMFRSESITSDAESVGTTFSEQPFVKDDAPPSAVASGSQAPLTPATSVASTPSASMFPPPPVEKTSSRRSSFSGSNAPGSPAHHGRYGRSPSPMPPLPAIRTSPTSSTWSTIKLYGDESFTNFFRRLTFSPDGGLLLTPAGQFEDPSIVPSPSKPSSSKNEEPTRGRKSRPSINTSDVTNPTSASSVFIYSRANFARPPIAQLPGHKKASVAVRFSPVLYDLRRGVTGPTETKTAVLEQGMDGEVALDLTDSSSDPVSRERSVLASPQNLLSPKRHSSTTPSHTPIAAPAPLLAAFGNLGNMSMPSPAMSPAEMLRPPTPAASKPSTPVPGSGSVFALPYRMLFAVVTMDTVTIYDTQQAGPVCMLTKLHYDEFTDMTWSPDGQCLILSSRDGYCTIVIFDEILPAHHTQQHTLQLQSIAHQHSVPISVTPAATPSVHHASLPPSQSPSIVPLKRSEPPLTPSTSLDGHAAAIGEASGSGGSAEADALPNKNGNEKSETQEPPKKKRRVALTRVGDLE